jgi:hypothetical protein
LIAFTEGLGEIGRRAQSIEHGAVHKNDLPQYGREIVEITDRLVRVLEDLQRDVRRALRES